MLGPWAMDSHDRSAPGSTYRASCSGTQGSARFGRCQVPNSRAIDGADVAHAPLEPGSAPPAPPSRWCGSAGHRRGSLLGSGVRRQIPRVVHRVSATERLRVCGPCGTAMGAERKIKDTSHVVGTRLVTQW